MLKAKLKNTQEVWDDIASHSFSKAKKNLSGFKEIDNYININYNETKENIKTLCFSKSFLFDYANPSVTPKKLVSTFISSSQGKFSDVVDMKCIDAFNAKANCNNKVPSSLITCNMLNQLMVITALNELSAEYERMLRIIEGMKNQASGRAFEEARLKQQQLQSTVRGVGYDVYSSSMITLLAHSIDNLQAVRQQQREADAQLEYFINSRHDSMINELTKQYDEYVETIFDPFIDHRVTVLFNVFKELILTDYIHHGNIEYI